MRHDRDLVQAVGHALCRQFGRIVFLRGSGLDADGGSARVSRVEVLGVARGDTEGGTDLDVGNHVGLCFTLGSDRKGGNAHVELGAQRGNNRGELRVVCGAVVQTHHLSERLVDIHVVALRGLQIVGQELCRRVVGRGAIAQDASCLDLSGDQGGDLFVRGDLGDVVRGRGRARAGRARAGVRSIGGRGRVRAGGQGQYCCGCECDESVCLRDGHDVPSDGMGAVRPAVAIIMHLYA